MNSTRGFKLIMVGANNFNIVHYALRDQIQDWEVSSLNYMLQSSKYDFTGYYKNVLHTAQILTVTCTSRVKVSDQNCPCFLKRRYQAAGI